MPAHVEKAARAYMFANVLGRGVSNSHFNIFTSSRSARSSHLRYITCPWHILPAVPVPPFPLLPSVPTPPHAFFTHKSYSWPWPGASAAPVGIGLGAPQPPGPRPVPPRHTPAHPTPPQPAVSPLPCRLCTVGKSLGNWVQIEDFNYS